MKTCHTTLHITEAYTQLLSTGDTCPAFTVTLILGFQKIAHDFFRHTPPTPLELENAIMAIEDEIMRAHKQIPSGLTLFTNDASIRAIALATDTTDITNTSSLILTLATVEQMFCQLTALSLGRPASSADIPNSREFAATLLILRELMHHLQFETVTVTLN